MNLTVDDYVAKALANAIHQDMSLRKITLIGLSPYVGGYTAEKLIHVLVDNFTLQEFSLSNRLNTGFKMKSTKVQTLGAKRARSVVALLYAGPCAVDGASTSCIRGLSGYSNCSGVSEALAFPLFNLSALLCFNACDILLNV